MAAKAADAAGRFTSARATKAGAGQQSFVWAGNRPLAAVELRAANGSNAAIAVMQPTPTNRYFRPGAETARS